MLDRITKEELDKMPDDEFIFLMFYNFGASWPIWEDCTKEEYERHTVKYNPDTDLLTDKILIQLVEEVFSSDTYRRVPIYHSGGGILNQIKYRKPEGYRYQKLVGIKNGLTLGNDMLEYCSTRECMKPFFKLNK